MKKIVSLLLVVAMLFCVAPTVFAASDKAVNAANALNALGLFQGVGTDANGKPIYDLDRTPSRAEAVTMLVRLLGKEEEAKSANWDIPFTDVAEWAKPYVGYAYTNGLTMGISETAFGSDDPTTATQYITFVLRALGYKSGTDFQWDSAWTLSDKIGMTNGEYNEANNDTFLRSGVASISYAALFAEEISDRKLYESLIDKGVFSYEKFKTVCNEQTEENCNENEEHSGISESKNNNIVEPVKVTVESSIIIDKNDVVTIVPVLSPKNAYTKYTWESSDDTIAKVSSAGSGTSGNITGVSSGIAIITVYTENGLSASCKVTVKDTLSASSMSINTKVTLDKGKQIDLTIRLTPSSSKTLYSATSSDESIVAVNTTGGRTGVRIRGVSAGEAEVTVYTDNGLSATCTVVVNDAPNPTDITIPTTYRMNSGETWDVPISLQPQGVSTVYNILSSDSTIVKVGTTGGRTGCRVTAYSTGTATITIYTENGLSASCEIIVE